MDEMKTLKTLVQKAGALTGIVEDDLFWMEAKRQAKEDPYFKARLKLGFEIKMSLLQERLLKLEKQLKVVKPDTFGWWICQLFNRKLIVNQQRYDQIMEEGTRLSEELGQWRQLRRIAKQWKLL